VLDIPVASALCGGMSAFPLASEEGAFAGVIEAAKPPMKRLDVLTEQRVQVLVAMGITQNAAAGWLDLDPRAVRGIVAQHVATSSLARDLARSLVLSVAPAIRGSYAVWFVADESSRMLESISTEQVFQFPRLGEKMVLHLTQRNDLPGRIVGVRGRFAVVSTGPVRIELSRSGLDDLGLCVSSRNRLAPSPMRRVLEFNIGSDCSDGRVTLDRKWLGRLDNGPAVTFSRPSVATIRARGPRLVFRPRGGVMVSVAASNGYGKLAPDDPSGCEMAVLGGKVGMPWRATAIARGDLYPFNLHGGGAVEPQRGQ
jgi:hypothetical protein